MQIIQSIREKGAAIIIVVIAISLVGFLLMDAKQGSGNGFFGGSGTTLGKVNGTKISTTEFNKRVKEQEDMETARTGQAPSGSKSNQLRDQVWNQMVAEIIFYEQTEKLGIDLTPSELKAVLLSNDQANPFTQERGMMDESGKLDMGKAQEAYNNIRKSKGDQREKVDAQIIEPLRLSTAVAKYSGMLNAAAYYPSWMKEKDTQEATDFATISYVAIPYSEISDSAVKVTDDDITTYVKKHKGLFKQEEGRTISYVTFSQLPTNEDSARTRKMLEDLRAPFMADTNSKAFVARNTSAIEFKDEYLPKAKITSAAADTLTKQPAGAVYGPYIEGKNMVLAKIIGTKTQPDSVNVRHILIGTVDGQSGKQIMEDGAAKKLADSLLTVINGGGDFTALAAKYSTDPGSKDSGGVYKNVSYGQMVPEFNQFIFGKPIGARDVVKTQFGYHVLEVLSQKNMSPAYKIAFLAKEISAGDVTINAASLAATRASANKNRKALEDYLKPSGKALIENPATVKENDYAVGSMQDARALVRWAFEAKKGDVSEPFSIGDDFVVATVDNVFDKGTQNAVTARKGAEAVVRNEKKAEMILKNLGSNPTMESAAAKYNKQVAMAGADSSITMSAQIINGLGVEYKLIGAAFNKDYMSKASGPIQGTTGIYFVKTTSVNKKPMPDAATAAQQSAQALTKIRNTAGNWFEALKNAADIKDKRSSRF